MINGMRLIDVFNTVTSELKEIDQQIKNLQSENIKKQSEINGFLKKYSLKVEKCENCKGVGTITEISYGGYDGRDREESYMDCENCCGDGYIVIKA